MARLLPVLSFTLRWTTADSTSHQNQSDALNVSRDYAPRAVQQKGHVTLVRLWMGSAMERRVPCSSSSEPERKKARKERAIRCLSERPRPRGSDAGLGEGASRGVAEVVAPPFASRVRMKLKPRRRRSRLADVCLCRQGQLCGCAPRSWKGQYWAWPVALDQGGGRARAPPQRATVECWLRRLRDTTRIKAAL